MGESDGIDIDFIGHAIMLLGVAVIFGLAGYRVVMG
jgi:hypothetical protein